MSRPLSLGKFLRLRRAQSADEAPAAQRLYAGSPPQPPNEAQTTSPNETPTATQAKLAPTMALKRDVRAKPHDWGHAGEAHDWGHEGVALESKTHCDEVSSAIHPCLQY